MRKTKLGCTILEGHDIADLPLVSENAEILEAEIEKIDKKASNITAGSVKLSDGSTVEEKFVAVENDVSTTGELAGQVKKDLDNFKTTNTNELNKKLNKAGDTATGILKAHSNTSYTVAQVRNIILSSNGANVNAMQDGEIWIKYK